ncbi:MAG: sulfotransferase domain-containing protein [Elainellaceae cyanobacterium]
MFKFAAEQLEQFRKTDVLVASFPRSGNTWLRYLISDIIQQKHGFQTQTDLPIHPNQVIPDLHCHGIIDCDPRLQLPFRLIKAHCFYNPELTARIVYLFRRPADVLCSYYYFHLRYESSRYVAADGIDSFCRQQLSNYVKHLTGYIEAKIRRSNDIFLISYENLHRNPVPTLQSLFSFCNYPVSDQIIERAIENHLFDNHHKHERVEELGYFERFFRKGEIGSATEELQASTIALIEKRALTLYDTLYSLEVNSSELGDKSLEDRVTWLTKSKKLSVGDLNINLLVRNQKVSTSQLLTLEQTLADQENLPDLCRDRPQVTTESFQPNDYYGMASVLKSYAGLPNDYSLKAVVPHGLSLSKDFVWETEVNAPLPAIFYHTAHVKSAYSRAVWQLNSPKLLLPCASPFLYVVELLKDQSKTDRNGTIFFPTHSTHHVTVEMSYEALAESIEKLGEIYKPVTICLYWRDLNLGRDKPFRDRGMKVVSAGHIYDPLFLFRLYHLCSLHQFAAGNGLGSHIFYSVKAGCSYFDFDIVERAYTVANNVPISSVSDDIYSNMKRLFSQPVETITFEQMKVVDDYTGAQYLKSSKLIQEELLRLEAAADLIFDMAAFLDIKNSEIDQRLDEIPSETSSSERRFLYQFFSRFWDGTKNACEIGPFLGGTTRAIALGMLQNPLRQEHAKLYTYDRFKDYYEGDRLISYLKPAFEANLLGKDAEAALLTSNSFQDIFQNLHRDQDYFELIVAQDQVLPERKADVRELDRIFSLPHDQIFSVIFVDGCKSWYATKYFMKEACPHAQEGSIFIFQDYNWYTCFWISSFLGRFKIHFNRIAAVDNTVIFQLVEPLDAATIEQNFPDEPTVADKENFDRFFSSLFLSAWARRCTYESFAATVQHSAALAYIGCIDEAKAKLLALANQAWARHYRHMLKSALEHPTYLPGGKSISLFTRDDITRTIEQADALNPDRLQIQETQAELERYQDALKQAQEEGGRFYWQLQASTETVRTLQATLQQTQSELQQTQTELQGTQAELQQAQEDLQRTQTRVQKVQSRLTDTRAKVKQSQQRLREREATIADMESSRFWKLREQWILLQQRFRPK